MRGSCVENSRGQYIIVAKAVFLSRPARPASCTKDSKEEGKFVCIVSLTFGLSMPIPKAFVATIMLLLSERNSSWHDELSPPLNVDMWFMPKEDSLVATEKGDKWTLTLSEAYGQNTIQADGSFVDS